MDLSETTETTVTTRVIRPFKIIATILVVIAIILMIPVLVSYVWIQAQTYHQGLWIECYSGLRIVPTNGPGEPTPSTSSEIKCYGAQPSGWLKAAEAFTIISLVLSVFGLLCALLALWKGKQYAIYFTIGGVLLIFSALCILIVLIIFPVKFMVEEVVPGRGVWELGWAWGLALGILVIQLVSGLLYIFAPDREEIYYSEKTYFS
ncbi:Transmembrane protein 47 [Holothuria leucospilota]|uniref:Transmembrane protein 47 n=1 Tax=Holothuria leucospilota TaxID=206669 RepID=A0A9Q1BDE5_HOLLE|nr:Transmembrane protein 47 [Holothuria leucospilota]